MAGTTSLVNQFDDIVAATGVLCAGTEGVFSQFVDHQRTLHTRLQDMVEENTQLKSVNEANGIKLKHARSSFDFQMQKRAEAEEALKQYEKQFTIILELLGDNRLNTLTADERRSLAFLKKNERRSSFSPGRSLLDEPSVVLSPSDVSVDPLDVDEEAGNGTKWKRRRTASVDKVTQKFSPPKKRKRSNEDAAGGQYKRGKSSLSPEGELYKVPRLEKQFKKPPPHRNRRRPTKAHLKQMASPGSGGDEMDTFKSPPPREDEMSQVSEFESDDAPSAPPLSPRMYPDLPSSDTEREIGVNFQVPVIPVTPLRFRSDINQQRRHIFFKKTLVKVETCQVCNKKVKFGQKCLKCRDCRAVCHPDCETNVPLPCVPSVPTPKKRFHDADLAAFCPTSVPRLPALIVHCITEIEKRGLTQVGIYRVPGSDKMIKEVKERLLRVKGNPGLERVEDINVLCGVVKDFLRKLREPLLTFRMHKAFMDTTEAESEEYGLASTLESIAELPPANKDTLAFIILHLQKVASYSDANKMPAASLAKVFGPTIVGHGCANPEPSIMWQDTQKQPKVMQRLLGISCDYWRQYLSPVDNPDPQSPTPSSQSSPGAISPATPELRPVPESPFLGSCQSPRSRGFAGRTPLMARSGVNGSSAPRQRRNGNFFAALQ